MPDLFGMVYDALACPDDPAIVYGGTQPSKGESPRPPTRPRWTTGHDAGAVRLEIRET